MVSFPIMLIEIKEDIIQAALHQKDMSTNEPLDLLVHMALCAKRGKHIVWVPSLDNDRNLRKDLGLLMTGSNVKALCYAANKHPQDINVLKSKFLRIVLTYKSIHSRNLIVVNPSHEKDFEPYTETFLLVENLIDADFFRIALKYYCSISRLNNGYCCSYYSLMGGGATSAQVLKREVQLRRHLCLAISDSDKCTPTSKTGQTGSDLLALVSSHPFNCQVYVMDKVREIEN